MNILSQKLLKRRDEKRFAGARKKNISWPNTASSVLAPRNIRLQLHGYGKELIRDDGFTKQAAVLRMMIRLGY